MAQQISHKKSLKKVNKERRAHLKEYYKLQDSDDSATDSKESESPSLAPPVVITHPKVRKPPQDDQPIGQLNFKDCVCMHNRLLSKEQETNNSIKNTIYENYYDLIKVNDLLKEVTGANEQELAKLKEAVKLLQE